MGRAERRWRTEKVLLRRIKIKKRKLDEYQYNRWCTPIDIGKLRNRYDSWACRCDYCFGGLINKSKVAAINFAEQLEMCGERHIIGHRTIQTYWYCPFDD